MPLSIQAACRARKRGKTEGKREEEVLLGLTTRWPSEADSADGSEGGEADKKKGKEKVVSRSVGG